MSGETGSRVRIVNPGAEGAKACAVVRSALAGGVAGSPAWSVHPTWAWSMGRTEITAASVFAPLADGGTEQGVGCLVALLVLGRRQPARTSGRKPALKRAMAPSSARSRSAMCAARADRGQCAQKVLQVCGQEGGQAQALACAVDGVGGQVLLLQPRADGDEDDGQVLERGGGGDPQPERGHEVSPGDGGGRRPQP